VARAKRYFPEQEVLFEFVPFLGRCRAKFILGSGLAAALSPAEVVLPDRLHAG
jgi:hypothetical protein